MPTEATPPRRGRKPKQPAPQASAQTAEQILRVPLTELHPFPDHPYGIREDQAMQDTVDSVKQNGVLVPAIVRPRAEGGYEIVAGHRRKLASERAGLPDMPCIVRNLSDDEAIIQLVDSNAQREDVLPSERAKAYKLRLEAVRRRAGRPRKEAADNDPFRKMRRMFRRIFAATTKWAPWMASAAIPSATSSPSTAWSRNCCGWWTRRRSP